MSDFEDYAFPGLARMLHQQQQQGTTMSKPLSIEALEKIVRQLKQDVEPRVRTIMVNDVKIMASGYAPAGTALVSDDVMVKILKMIDDFDDMEGATVERITVQ